MTFGHDLRALIFGHGTWAWHLGVALVRLFYRYGAPEGLGGADTPGGSHMPTCASFCAFCLCSARSRSAVP